MKLKVKKSKIGIIILLSAVIILICASCKHTPSDKALENKYKLGDIPDKSYLFEKADVIYPYDGKIYAASENSIGYYDISNDMAYTLLASDISASIICVQDGELCAVCKDSVVILNLVDGTNTKYNAEIGETDVYYTDIAFDNDSIFIATIYKAGEDFTKRELYTFHIDRAEGIVDITLVNSDYELSEIYDIEKKNNKNEYVFLCKYSNNAGFLTNGKFTYSNGALMLDKIFGDDGNLFDYDTSTGDSYGMINDYSVLKLIKLSDKDDSVQLVETVDMEQFMNNVNEVVETAVSYNTKLFYTGKDFLIWDDTNHLINVCGLRESGETLTVLYPINGELDFMTGELDSTVYDDIEYDMLAFENKYDCNVQGITYTIPDFTDRLRLKLLAEEDDFDIVYADRCNRGDILSAILRYQLYLPIEDYTNITSNLANLADGIADFMTYDGHLIGSPYRIDGMAFVLTRDYITYLKKGLPMPESDWTLDDFYELCEAAIPYCVDGTAFVSMPESWIIQTVIQNGIDNGNIDRDEIYKHVEKIDKYQKAGVFARGGEANTFLLRYCTLPPNNAQYYTYFNATDEIIPLPSYNGKRYADLSSFIFVNRNTKNSSIAIDYITMLLSPDFVSKTERYKSCYAKDPESYFKLEWGDLSSINLWRDNNLELNKWNKSAVEFDYPNDFLISRIADGFTGTSIYTSDGSELSSTVLDITKRLKNGNITVDDATDEIFKYVKYRYFE